MPDLFQDNGAEFSPCGKYRYKLWRIWDKSLPLVMFIGLNPSTADASEDDPTIKSVCRLAKNNGYGGIYMTNLFTIISPDPKILKSQNEWTDTLKDVERLREVRRICKDVVFAWGNFKEAQQRQYLVAREFPGALCIKKNKNDTPVHPLYQKSNSKFTLYA